MYSGAGSNDVCVFVKWMNEMLCCWTEKKEWYTMWTQSTPNRIDVSVVVFPSHASSISLCAERILLCLSAFIWMRKSFIEQNNAKKYLVYYKNCWERRPAEAQWIKNNNNNNKKKTVNEKKKKFTKHTQNVNILELFFPFFSFPSNSIYER